jgi:phosphohistidine phosphatase
MNLYLVQHGEAKPEREDPERPLADRGRDDIVRLGKLLARAGVRVSEIRHSGKRRAHETAQILAKALQPAGGVVLEAGLAPKDPVESIAREVSSLNEDIMLVGHLPHLGRLATVLLLAGRHEPPVVRFVPGTLARLDRSDGWSVGWLVPPELTLCG